MTIRGIRYDPRLWLYSYTILIYGKMNQGGEHTSLQLMKRCVFTTNLKSKKGESKMFVIESIGVFIAMSCMLAAIVAAVYAAIMCVID